MLDLKITLTSKRLVLCPFDIELHSEELYDEFKGTSVAKWLPFDIAPTLQEYQAFLHKLDHKLYLVKSLEGQLVGMIGYLNLRPEHKSIEIGHIIIIPSCQRLGYGVEAGKILVQHAIKASLYRIEWKTHHENVASQSCALKIGFKFEGTFRNHMFVKGHHRHSYYYSLIPEDFSSFVPPL